MSGDRALRGLTAVLGLDAATVAALGAVAAATRRRPAGPGYAAVAATAALSLVPGVVAVARERRAHRTAPPAEHAATITALLFVAGSAVCSAGTGAVAHRYGWPRRGRGPLPAVNTALLVGGNLVGVPYLAFVAALHR
ncbi:hypothetical protein [Kineococcus aurantiacus]|uniref:Uncharacterized protein n=1 Tax=Kineococcus aurantiacus TaxID=37633 RepID=A0A7Y9DL66_9ACTN|nr:hypothetical protein [Kineococcus aurantiacus]